LPQASYDYSGGANGGLGILPPGQVSEDGRAVANADGILVVPVGPGERPDLFGPADNVHW
jgi:hypothetical protein